MAQEWRVIQRTRGSIVKQLWVRLRSGLWAPTERFMCDAQMMPPIMGGSPGTVDKQVGLGGDDGVRYTGTDGFTAVTAAFRVGYRTNAASLHCHGFARWTGVTIEGTIDTSYIECYAQAGGFKTPELKVYGVDEDNPPAPTSAAEFDADPLTTAAVDWDGAWTLNTWEQSPSLNAIFQELVNAYTISDEALMVQIKNDHGVTGSNEYNYPRAYESTGYGPKLHIEYTAGGAVYYHGLKVQGEGELALCDVGNHPLRIRKGGTTYGIELVATDDPNASRIRIKTPTGIKAIRKYT